MLGMITCNGSGVGRLGITGFDFSSIPSGATISSVRIANFVLSNQGYTTTPNTITVGFYPDATILPASAFATSDIELVNGPARFDYASECPTVSSISRSQLIDPDFGVIVELEERGAVLIYSLDLIVEYRANPASLKSQYQLDAIPDLPEELHELLPMLMAIKAGSPMATDEGAWARLLDLKRDVAEMISNVQTENAEVNSPFNSPVQHRKKWLDMTNGTVY